MADTVTPEQQQSLENISVSAPAVTSIDDIIASEFIDPSFSGLENGPIPEVTVEGNKDIQSQKTPTELVSQIDQLSSELEDIKLENPKSPESLGNFNGLKSKYNKKLNDFKQAILELTEANSQYSEKVRELEPLQEKIKDLDIVKTQLLEAEKALNALKEENRSLNVFRKKYDLENDPEIKRSYIDPMKEYKRIATEILQGYDVDHSVWDEIISTDNEFKINSILDSRGIVGLNAASLKEASRNYKHLQREYAESTKPEYIDSLIAKTKGKSQQVSEEVANDVFDSVKTNFSKHVTQLRESDINKEHNIFVYDKVLETANNTYNALRKSLGDNFQNENVIAVLARASFMTAAYPYQHKFTEYLMERYQEVLEENRELKSGGPDIEQRKESTSLLGLNSPQDVIRAVKQAKNQSLEDIVDEAF